MLSTCVPHLLPFPVQGAQRGPCSGSACMATMLSEDIRATSGIFWVLKQLLEHTLSIPSPIFRHWGKNFLCPDLMSCTASFCTAKWRGGQVLGSQSEFHCSLPCADGVTSLTNAPIFWQGPGLKAESCFNDFNVNYLLNLTETVCLESQASLNVQLRDSDMLPLRCAQSNRSW